MNLKKIFLFISVLLAAGLAYCQTNNLPYHEQYRPQIHFSPKEKWTNDPNGMVYYNGIYHLFFQYYPDSTIWGPMHWGHATSEDLIHWQQQPIALYPDSLGYIFSGSAVVDKNNTSGFGKNSEVPLVAIFTQHNPKGEKEGKNDFQNQSIAYSLDNGKTWTKYAGNPVLHNPGITDFRDPKVIWYEPQKKWLMTLATKNCITFYSSPDLKKWTKESEFGKELGAHGGVWECPDLFSFEDNGKKIWVLIVNVNPGGPNGGSATQYFVGNFDGKNFTTSQTDTRWIDYGPDEYAGVTWSNTGNRKIFLGWMSNWLYANVVPTVRWRNAMTIPRELKLRHVDENIFVTSQPVKEIDKIIFRKICVNNILIEKNLDLSKKIGNIQLPCRINFNLKPEDFSLIISNELNEKIVIGFDKQRNQYFINRTQSGKVDFNKEFAAKYIAPRLAKTNEINLSLIVDVSSIELFADDGLTVMTAIFFPSKLLNKIMIQTPGKISINNFQYAQLNSIWN